MSIPRLAPQNCSPIFTALVAFYLLTCLPVFAGDDPGKTSERAAASDAVEVEAIIVTAQKQVQDVKDVPITVSVFDACDLEDMNIEIIKDILVHTPNMSYFAAGAEGLGTPNIRGLTASLRTFGT